MSEPDYSDLIAQAVEEIDDVKRQAAAVANDIAALQQQLERFHLFIERKQAALDKATKNVSNA